MKKNYILIVAVLISFLNLNAQAFLNGSFEITSTTTCMYNLSNTNFNTRMSNVNAFGLAEEIDIQRIDCYVPSIPDGNVVISLNAKPSNGAVDAISLDLSSPLIIGKSYKMTFSAFGNTSFSNTMATINIGCSTTKNNPSAPTIFTPVLVPNQWVSYSFDFIAPNDGKYITVIPVTNPASESAWTALDDFKITESLSTDESGIKNSVKIYPNPVRDFIKVAGLSTRVNYSIVNVLGHKVDQGAISEHEKIDATKLSKGLYFLLLENGNKIKFIKE